MESLRLIIRFDDICPTMNRDIWEKVEYICNKNKILPVIAVIPDNKDPKFSHKEDPFFWNRIKGLQDAGWSVGLHGLHHTYISKNSGLMKITDLSEFVPRPFIEQDVMIKRGMEIFQDHEIKVDMFIAPCHSFDNNTIKALKNNNIYTISDGFYSRPVNIDGMNYIPSQLWERSKIPEKGLYTICCHTENWSSEDLVHFESLIKKYSKNIISFSDIDEINKARNRDKLSNWLRINLFSVKKKIKRILVFFLKKSFVKGEKK